METSVQTIIYETFLLMWRMDFPHLKIVTFHTPDCLGSLSTNGQHDFRQAYWLPRLCSGRCEGHAELEISLQQVELHSLDDEVLAVVIGLEQGLGLYPVEEVLLGQERQPYMLQELRQMSRPLVCVKIYPGDDALKHLLLAGDCDGVAGNQLSHLIRGQAIKLVTFQNLERVFKDSIV